MDRELKEILILLQNTTFPIGNQLYQKALKFEKAFFTNGNIYNGDSLYKRFSKHVSLYIYYVYITERWREFFQIKLKSAWKKKRPRNSV